MTHLRHLVEGTNLLLGGDREGSYLAIQLIVHYIVYLCTSIFSANSLTSNWTKRVCLHGHEKKHTQ